MTNNIQIFMLQIIVVIAIFDKIFLAMACGPCSNGGYCLLNGTHNGNTDQYLRAATPICICPEEFGGDFCEKPLQLCDDGVTKCYFGASCSLKWDSTNGDISYDCDCASATYDGAIYTGKFCEHQATSICIEGYENMQSWHDHGEHFCANGGECKYIASDKDSTFDGCYCLEDFTGSHCEFKVVATKPIDGAVSGGNDETDTTVVKTSNEYDKDEPFGPTARTIGLLFVGVSLLVLLFFVQRIERKKRRRKFLESILGDFNLNANSSIPSVDNHMVVNRSPPTTRSKVQDTVCNETDLDSFPGEERENNNRNRDRFRRFTDNHKSNIGREVIIVKKEPTLLSPFDPTDTNEQTSVI